MAFEIIRGTTPTIEFKFSNVAVESITKAIFSINQNGTIVVEKDLAAATVGESTLSWVLTQAECLSLAYGSVSIMLNWLLADGTRGASRIYNVEVITNHILEVIV